MPTSRQTLTIRLNRYWKAVEEYRKEWGLYFYRPMPHQVQFHSSKDKYRALCGANRQGKSYSTSEDAIWYALGVHPWLESPMAPVTVAVVSPKYTQQREAAQKIVLGLLPPLLRDTGHRFGWKPIWQQMNKRKLDFIQFNDGSRILFYSAESGEDTPQGSSVDYWLVDEEVPTGYMDEAFARLGGGRKMIFVFAVTTLEGRTWIVTRIIEPGLANKKGYTVVRSPIEVNSIAVGGYLLPEEIEDLKKLWGGDEDEWTRRVRLQGEILDLSARCVFSRNAVLKAKEDLLEPLSVEGYWKFWSEPVTGHNYVVACDPATGQAKKDKHGQSLGDFQAIFILDMTAGRQAAEYHSHAEQPEVAEELAEACKKWNNAPLILEVNIAVLMLDWVRQLYPRVKFYSREPEPDQILQNFTDLRGWKTTTRTKPQLIQNANKVLMARRFIFHSKDLLSEVGNYVQTDKGIASASAAAGYHDDRCMAWMLAVWFARDFVAKVVKVKKKDEIDWSKPVFLPARKKGIVYEPILGF